MKLSNYDHVYKHVNRLTELRAKRRDIEKPGVLGVTINGYYQDAHVLAAVLPVMQGLLDQEIQNIESDLRSLGVDVDE